MLKKYCNHCQVELTLDNNYGKGTGFVCKTCWNKRRWRYPFKTNYEVMRRYAQTEMGKKKRREASQRAYIKHKPKWLARIKVREAVRKGLIEKTPCISIWNDPCNGKVQGHHCLGYEGEHWKDVMWLCPKHHARTHAQERVKQVKPNAGKTI